MKIKNAEFSSGLSAGLPICLGYLSVAFVFGIFAVESGLTPPEAILVSMFNLTSAGQFAAVPIIASLGPLTELILSQAVINMRYALMSVSLSQKFDSKINIFDRLLFAFCNTDEIFAVATSKKGTAGRSFMLGLIVLPYVGWTLGTVAGATAGNILPDQVISALGCAIYAMFIAIVLPEAKKSSPVRICVLISAILSCILYFLPFLKGLSDGMRIIIVSVAVSIICAVIAPIKDDDKTEVCEVDK